MGWVNSPPYFCAATETVADLVNHNTPSPSNLNVSTTQRCNLRRWQSRHQHLLVLLLDPKYRINPAFTDRSATPMFTLMILFSSRKVARLINVASCDTFFTPWTLFSAPSKGTTIHSGANRRQPINLLKVTPPGLPAKPSSTGSLKPCLKRWNCCPIVAINFLRFSTPSTRLLNESGSVDGNKFWAN